MIPVAIPNRPFSTELYTGLMLPDGIFESSLGNQALNAQIQNAGASAVSGLSVYVESASHPAIVVTPQTYSVPALAGGAARVLSWPIDVSAVPPGEYQISFITKTASDQRRVIKKIFVTKVTFNPVSGVFRADTPQGSLAVQFHDLIKPREPCCPPQLDWEAGGLGDENFVSLVGRLYKGHDPNFAFCPPGYLPRSFDASVTPGTPYPGQYGDLPFQDPWWKILLCIIALILLIAAAVVAAVTGKGSIGVTAGTPDSSGGTPDCCGIRAKGGSSSYIVAGLVAAAAAVATAAGLSDVRDPFRRGEEHTVPATGELTTSESVKCLLSYPEPVQPGRPFAVQAKWEYARTTTGAMYTYAATDVNKNVHVISKYSVEMPNVVRLYKDEPFIVKAQFYGPDQKLYVGHQLFVQCILAGPHGEWRRFILQDDGNFPDMTANDGTYTGIHYFEQDRPDPRGLWMVYVIAQDVNTATPDMKPEDAAELIGGMLLTDQIQISFNGGTCPLVPNGDVNVI
jgi:hypothetical protein